MSALEASEFLIRRRAALLNQLAHVKRKRRIRDSERAMWLANIEGEREALRIAIERLLPATPAAACYPDSA